jgi:hypothetical protein
VGISDGVETVSGSGFIEGKNTGPTSTDGEAGQPLRRLVEPIEALDLGAARAIPAEVDQVLYIVSRPLEDRLDGPVGAISHPSGETPLQRATAGGITEEDTLNTSVNYHSHLDRILRQAGCDAPK